MTEYSFHSLRKDDPLPTESEICARMQEIRNQGLRHPIILFQGQILVGRTDYLACEGLNTVPRFVVKYSLSDPQGFITASRVHRGQEAFPPCPTVNRTPTQLQNREREQPEPEMRQQTVELRQQFPAARKQAQSTADREYVRRLAFQIGIRAAAREYGLKESRVLNWACRYSWHIGKRKH